jgi:hypothetical protein
MKREINRPMMKGIKYSIRIATIGEKSNPPNVGIVRRNGSSIGLVRSYSIIMGQPYVPNLNQDNRTRMKIHRAIIRQK